MAQYRPTWLEEPLPPSDHAAYRKLRAAKPLPIATGEHEQEEAGFLDLIETNAAGVGKPLEVVVRDKPVAAVQVKTPFYKRQK